MMTDPKWGSPSPFHDPLVLSRFRARAGDVLITTAPKAGTTWMQQILHQLRCGGDEDFHSIDEVVPWLELHRSGLTVEQVLADFERLPVPRVFKTHCTYEQCPGLDTARVILTTRDPRDCCVSFYHHLRDMTDEARERHGIVAPASLSEYVDEWLSFGSWYRNVESWWPHRERDNILMLRYEDLKRDLASGMRQILAFLGWELSERGFAHALACSSFAWMKENSWRFTALGKERAPVFKPGGFIRSGKVGEGRSSLAPEHEARILRHARERLEPECLAFLGIAAQ